MTAEREKGEGVMEPEVQAGASSAIQVLIWLLVYKKILPAEELVAELERSSRFHRGAAEARLRSFAMTARAAGDRDACGLMWYSPIAPAVRAYRVGNWCSGGASC